MAPRHVSLAAGLVLTTGSAVSAAVIATAGVDIAGTGWTRAGWLFGAAAIGAGVGMLASLAHKPRPGTLPRRPAVGRVRLFRAPTRPARAAVYGTRPTVQFSRPRVEGCSTWAGAAGATPAAVTRRLPRVPPGRGGLAPAGGGPRGLAATSLPTWPARGAAHATGLYQTTNTE